VTGVQTCALPICHSYFADRRPRFLVRRKTGTLGVRMKIKGREIFARD
jgi:hypothetical protein